MMRILWLLFSVFLTSQVSALHVNVDPVIFMVEDKHVLELNFHYESRALHFDTILENETQLLSASVKVNMRIKKDGDLVRMDRYIIHSPNTSTPSDFLDVRAYELEPGIYDLQLEFVDRMDSLNYFLHNESIRIPVLSDRPAFSGLKLLADYGKQQEKGNQNKEQSSLQMEPLPHHIYQGDKLDLHFYAEFYNIHQLEEDPLIFQYNIMERTEGEWTNILSSYEMIQSRKRKIPILKTIDISGLPSNSYQLEVNLIDKDKNRIKSKSSLFVVHNKEVDKRLVKNKLENESENFFLEMDLADLRYSIKAIATPAGQGQQRIINNIIERGKKRDFADYLYNYWVNEDPKNTRDAYKEYMKLADALDDKFYNAFGYGFETDRGMIYLKYGPPTRTVRRENDQGAYPYEIWTYDQIEYTNQTDVKFVFYNPTMGGNDYILLHSNCRNEIQNPQWLREIYHVGDQSEGDNYIDATGVRDNFAREAERLYHDN